MGVPAIPILIMQPILLEQVATARIVSHLLAVVSQAIVPPTGGGAHQAIQGVVGEALRLGCASQVILQAEQVAGQVGGYTDASQMIAEQPEQGRHCPPGTILTNM